MARTEKDLGYVIGPKGESDSIETFDYTELGFNGNRWGLMTFTGWVRGRELHFSGEWYKKFSSPVYENQLWQFNDVDNEVDDVGVFNEKLLPKRITFLNIKASDAAYLNVCNGICFVTPEGKIQYSFPKGCGVENMNPSVYIFVNGIWLLNKENEDASI